MNKIKTAVNVGITLIILSLGITSYISIKRIHSLQVDLSNSRNNEKAYMIENDSLSFKNRIFKMSIEQLEYSKDSILQKMENVKKELKIKDRNLKSMEYLLSEAKRKDTVYIKDTIFKDPNLDIDTTVKDRWYNLNVGLKFPNIIMIEPTFISEKYIITNYKKETVKPPKKCAIARWFQKKHKIVEVEVVEKNPYIKTKKQKFVEIIK